MLRNLSMLKCYKLLLYNNIRAELDCCQCELRGERMRCMALEKQLHFYMNMDRRRLEVE